MITILAQYFTPVWEVAVNSITRGCIRVTNRKLDIMHSFSA